MLAQNNHNNRMARVVANGFIMLGRCIPSVCTDQDLAAGWYNFLAQADVKDFILYPLNCHTADEKSKILFYWSEVLKTFSSVSLEPADYGMIALLAIFGILLAIGTIADFILNILNLRVLPEKFLQVKSFQKIDNL